MSIRSVSRKAARKWSAEHCSNGVAVMAIAIIMSFRGAKRRGNPLNRNANTLALPLTALVLAITNRAENLCYQFRQGQNSCRNFARLSAWCLACKARKWNIPQSKQSLDIIVQRTISSRSDITAQSAISFFPLGYTTKNFCRKRTKKTALVAKTQFFVRSRFQGRFFQQILFQ